MTSLAIGAFLVFALAGTEPATALPWWYTLIGTVWFAGICHAINLLDNMDGLAAGVALIAAAFLAALLRRCARPAAGAPARRTGRMRCSAFSTGIGRRARLFMGDCGSLFIGALLGGASLVPVFQMRVSLANPESLFRRTRSSCR